MKRLLCGICGLAVMVILAVPGLAQKNPRGTSTLEVKGKMVSVEYGKPSLKGRGADEMLVKLPTEHMKFSNMFRGHCGLRFLGRR